VRYCPWDHQTAEPEKHEIIALQGIGDRLSQAGQASLPFMGELIEKGGLPSDGFPDFAIFNIEPLARSSHHSGIVKARVTRFLYNAAYDFLSSAIRTTKDIDNRHD
jgi:hypothetical protein